MWPPSWFWRRRPAIAEARSDSVESPGWRVDARALVNLLSGLGVFGVDKGASTRVVRVRKFADDELRTMFDEVETAAKVVSLLPRHAMREGFGLETDGEPDTDLDAALADLHAEQHFLEADKWGRLYGQAWVLVVTDAVDWSRPIRDGERVLALRSRDLRPRFVVPRTWVEDERSERFGLPETYDVWLRSGGVSHRRGGVHWTRLISFLGDPVDGETARELPYWAEGQSVLQKRWGAVDAYEQHNQSRTSLIQDLSYDVVRVGSHKSLAVGDQSGGYMRMLQLISQAKSRFRAVGLGPNDDLITRNRSVSGLAELDREARTTLTSAAEVPQSVWFGEPPPGLSTDGRSGRETWHASIRAHQRNDLSPGVLRLAELVKAQRAYGGAQGTTKVVFPPLDAPTRLETGQAEQAEADADATRIESGVLTAEQVTAFRYPDAAEADGHTHEVG